ncbi:MAG: hypothetical protein IKW77_09450 [Salinivirgaceae bacterium]|nr:hypothetical protein [Salinivirgaceae bacterium]
MRYGDQSPDDDTSLRPLSSNGQSRRSDMYHYRQDGRFTLFALRYGDQSPDDSSRLRPHSSNGQRRRCDMYHYRQD